MVVRHKEKVLLLNPPGDRLYLRDSYCPNIAKGNYYWPPIDLLIQSGVLKEYFQVEVLDAIVTKMLHEDCNNKIINGNYKALFSLTSSPSWKQDFTFLAKIKKNINIKIICGGDIFLDNPTKMLGEYSFLDAILLDFNSDVIPKYLNGETELYDIVYRKNGEIINAPYKKLKHYKIPVPQHELFPLNKYKSPHGKRRPFTVVITSFSCPFSCNFCVSNSLKYKERDIENVVSELKHIVSLKIKEVWFFDMTFCVNKSRVLQLCNRILEEQLDLTWICMTRVDTIDDEMLSLMKKAGCHTIMFGIESGNDNILMKSLKGFTKKQAIEAFNLCNKYRIRNMAHFIIGLPGETEETILETIEFSKKLKCDYATFNVAMPFMGSNLRKEAIEKKWISPEVINMDTSFGDPIFETPQLTKDTLRKLNKFAVRQFYFRTSYFLQTIAKIRSIYDIRNIVNQFFSLLNNYYW